MIHPIIVVEVPFNFLLKLNLNHPYTFNRYWSRITMLRTIASVLKHVESRSIQMAFKRVISWNRMIRGHVNLVISLFSYLYSNYSPCNFNFTGKTVPLPSTDIIIVALFCFSFLFFFSLERYHLLFLFC